MYDLGVHLLDQVVVAFGMPATVTGFVRPQGDGRRGHEDCVTAILGYEGGLMVTVKAAAVSPEEKQLRFWVRGTQGSYKKVRTALIVRCDIETDVRAVWDGYPGGATHCWSISK